MKNSSENEEEIVNAVLKKTKRKQRLSHLLKEEIKELKKAIAFQRNEIAELQIVPTTAMQEQLGLWAVSYTEDIFAKSIKRFGLMLVCFVGFVLVYAVIPVVY